MQKVYLLLRSNKQTGPYSLEELLQLNLKPFDLVWVEGRSAAWQYPSEIPSLKAYVPETPQTTAPFQPVATSAMEEKSFQKPDPNPIQQNPIQNTNGPKRVFVSIPKTYNTAREQTNYSEQSPYAPKAQPLHETKEELDTTSRSSSQSIPLHSGEKPVDEEVHTNYSRSLNDVEEDYTAWVYNKKTKKKASVNPKELVLATLILAVIGGGYYVMSKPSVANSVLPANKITNETTELATEKTVDASAPAETVSMEKTAAVDNNVSSVNDARPEAGKMKNPASVSKAGTNSSVPSSQNSMPVEKTTPNIPNKSDDVAVNNPEVKQQPKENSEPEKKKKFGEVLKGIFSKKEKKEEAGNNEPVMEDPKPANDRQATRRDADNNSGTNPPSNETSTAGLMEQVDLSSNAPDNWMMGVKNLKLTLRNRSNVTIQAAAVTVNYYDGNDRLLEKKLVYFNNVAPKGKATVAAPDHKFADHIDFKLTTVSAKEDRYARSER